MNAHMIDQIFVDTFFMVNFEITFKGVQSWFAMAGQEIDDSQLFRSLLIPESFQTDKQAEMMSLIVYRHEDVFFQANRCVDTEASILDPLSDTNELIHQLLLSLMNTRTLRGEKEALLDLYVILQQDRLRDEPMYSTLHGLFDQKWGLA